MRVLNEIWTGRAEILKDCLLTLGTWIWYIFLALLALAFLVAVVAAIWECISQRKDRNMGSSGGSSSGGQGVPQGDHWSSGMFG